MPTETMKTKKYALLYGRKEYGKTEKVPAFADTVSKAIFLTENGKKYIAYLLFPYAGYHIIENIDKIRFYKNIIGKTKIEEKAYCCDIAVIYKKVLYQIEFNDSTKKDDRMRNLSYVNINMMHFDMEYQSRKIKADEKEKIKREVERAVLINFNNFGVRGKEEKIEDVYYIQNDEKNLYTKKVQIVDIYLPNVWLKYYNGDKELTEYEKFLFVAYTDKRKDALKVAKGSEIMEDLYHDNVEVMLGDIYENTRTIEYRANSAGYDRGYERGEENANQKTAEILKSLHVSPEIIEKATGISFSKKR